jgi:hypothetical protein
MKDEGLMETKEETCKERKRLQHIFYFISLFLVTLVSLLYKEIQGIGFNKVFHNVKSEKRVCKSRAGKTPRLVYRCFMGNT